MQQPPGCLHKTFIPHAVHVGSNHVPSRYLVVMNRSQQQEQHSSTRPCGNSKNNVLQWGIMFLLWRISFNSWQPIYWQRLGILLPTHLSAKRYRQRTNLRHKLTIQNSSHEPRMNQPSWSRVIHCLLHRYSNVVTSHAWLYLTVCI